VPNHVHQIGRVFAVMDRKRGIEPEMLGIFAQQTGADAVERAGPTQRIGHDDGTVSHNLSRDALDTPGHLGGGAARKRHQQYPPGIGAIDDQMGDPVRQGAGLPGTGTGDDEERGARCGVLLPHAVLDSLSLFAVEAFKISSVHRANRSGALWPLNHNSCFVRSRPVTQAPAFTASGALHSTPAPEPPNR